MPSTIYALSSAHGKAGVAIIRLSGPKSQEVYTLLTRHSSASLKPRCATFKKIYDLKTGEIIDKAVILFFKAPHSFTGEDVLELHVHGSLAVVKTLFVNLQSIKGLVLAEPGAFTRRSFENGKMDLLEVEALSDLIQAETESQHRQAIRQMVGDVGNLYVQWKDDLLNALAFLEALIDFSEDQHFEDEAHVEGHVGRLLLETQNTLEKYLSGPSFGEKIREGLEVAIVGAPNVGKSSLLNILACRDIALVSPLAGTTRDIVETHLNLGGFAVTLRDTAGVHTPSDEGRSEALVSLEKMGMTRALACAQQADIRLFVISVDYPFLPDAYHPLYRENDIFILNKVDLLESYVPRGTYDSEEIQKCSTWNILQKFQETLSENVPRGTLIKKFYPCSTWNNIGLHELLEILQKTITHFMNQSSYEFPIITRARHRDHVSHCHSFLKAALHKLQDQAGLEFIAEDIRGAIRALGHITGTVDIEEILGLIFSEFCIGK